MKKSLSLRISFITICMILVCATCTGIISYAFYRSDSIEANAQRALDIARSAATMVDGDEMRAIMATLEENDYFHALKAILDEISTSTGAQFLYVLDREYDTQVTYFVEGYNHNSDEEPTGLGDREATKYYNALTFTALDTGTEQMTGIYDSDGYGAMVSGLVPIFDSAGVVVGVLGVDLGVDDVLASSQVFALRSVIVVVVLCALLGAVSFQVITRMVGRPVRTLTAVASAVAMGDTDVKVDITSQDELGDLAAAFRSIVENSREQARVMEALARGDLTQRPIVRNEKDAINRAIAGTLSNLNAMFGDVRNMAAGVSSGSAQMAQGAQALASGSTQQAAAIQQLSASTQDILRQAEDSARQARDAYEDTRQAGALMDESIGSMTRMTEAMAGISAASQAISQVISVIDGIAFQTSILSLNASVEAARAGQHGRGFAVVAEEVRSLAAKSAQAAQETAALIQNSIRRVQEGSDIARDTSKSLEAVAQLAGRNAAAMHAINETSQQQTTAIAEINKGIEQISMVVQQSSATAQESAASSHEMDAQAQQLTDMVSRFKLDTPDALPPTVGGYLNAPGGRF